MLNDFLSLKNITEREATEMLEIWNHEFYCQSKESFELTVRSELREYESFCYRAWAQKIDITSYTNWIHHRIHFLLNCKLIEADNPDFIRIHSILFTNYSGYDCPFSDEKETNVFSKLAKKLGF